MSESESERERERRREREREKETREREGQRSSPRSVLCTDVDVYIHTYVHTYIHTYIKRDHLYRARLYSHYLAVRDCGVARARRRVRRARAAGGHRRFRNV